MKAERQGTRSRGFDRGCARGEGGEISPEVIGAWRGITPLMHMDVTSH